MVRPDAAPSRRTTDVEYAVSPGDAVADWRRMAPLWRLLTAAVLLYLPIEGVIALLFYSFKPALLFKDVLLVVAYGAFAAWVLKRRPRVEWPSIGTIPLAIFIVVALVEFFHPTVESLPVALIGFKTRLFYIPVALLGWFWVRSQVDLHRLMFLIVVPSIPVNLVAIWQYLLGPARVAAWGEGFAASIWTVGTYAGAAVYRPAATFSSTGHYGNYLMLATFVTAAWCAHRDGSSAMRWLCRSSLALQLVGVMVHGGRTTLLFVPAGVIAIWTLAAVRLGSAAWRRPQAMLLSANCAILVTGLGLGLAVAPTALYRAQSIVAPSEYRQLNMLDTLIVSANRLMALPAADLWLGHGLGSASPGARYIMAEPTRLVTDGRMESQIGQLIWETGLVGAGGFYLAWGAFLAAGIRSYVMLRGSLLQSVASALLFFNGSILISSATYAPIAYSPVSVLFWFLLPLPLALGKLETSSQR